MLSIRREYQGVYASDAMKTSPTMSHLDPVPDVDLAWLANEDAGEAFRAYRTMPDETRGSVLAHAVAALTVPHLGDDHDVSGALEETVRDLDIDFPAELAAVGAMPLDDELVWNRMNKGLILGAAAETLGEEWVDRHGALKKKDLVAAAGQAFRHDPARDAAVDDPTRWLPPGFVPRDSGAADPQPAASESVDASDRDAQAGEADALPTNGVGGDAPAPVGGNRSAVASDDGSATANDGEPSPDADGAALPAFLTAS